MYLFSVGNDAPRERGRGGYHPDMNRARELGLATLVPFLFVAACSSEDPRPSPPSVANTVTAQSAPLPRYAATSTAGDALEAFLHDREISFFEPPVEFGCDIVAVLGADLSKGAVDMIFISNRCEDPVLTWFAIRDGRVKSTGSEPQTDIGKPGGFEAFQNPYGNYSGVLFDVAPGESRVYLYPAS